MVVMPVLEVLPRYAVNQPVKCQSKLRIQIADGQKKVDVWEKGARDVPQSTNRKSGQPRHERDQKRRGQRLLPRTDTRLEITIFSGGYIRRVFAGPLLVGQRLERQTQVRALKHNEGEVQKNERHLGVV